MYSVLIQAPDARAAVDQIEAAEAAGVEAAWAISSGVGGADLVPVFTAALARTERIVLGTAILRTWTRHPICFADEVVALEQLFPGRFRLGIGQTGRRAVTMYGANYAKPLTHVKEYVAAIKAYLAGEVAMTAGGDGSGDGSGDGATEGANAALVTANATNPNPCPQAPVILAAAGLKAFEAAGELADGALSWVAPLPYLRDRALPAMAAGAERADRPVPPLIAHVPVALTADPDRGRDLIRRNLASYAQAPFFKAQWALGGHDPEAGWTDELIDEVAICGDEGTVAAGLGRWLEEGMGEVYVQPMADPDDRTVTDRVFALVGGLR